MNIKERGIFHTKMVYEQKIATAGKGWSPLFSSYDLDLSKISENL